MSNTEVARYFAISQPKLRAYIRSIIFNASDVDDILQEVAVVAIENSDRFDPNQSINAWVFGITRNRVFKYIEKKNRQKLSFSTEVVEAITESAMADEARKDSLDALECCLEQLEDGHRDLLVKRHQKGVTARKLAQEIGYTDTRMSRLINSLYASLMKCIERQISSHPDVVA